MKARANFLISGRTQVFDQFLVTEIKDTWTDFAGLGTPQNVKFSATFNRVQKGGKSKNSGKYWYQMGGEE